MKDLENKKIKGNNKLVLIIVGIIIISTLIIIGVLNSKDKNNTIEISNGNENISSGVEEEKATWQSDSQEKSLLDKIKYEKNFPSFYNEIIEYSQDNLFVKAIKEKTDKFNYANLQQAEKDVLEVYIYEMFKETNNEVSTTDINNKKISKAYWSEFTYVILKDPFKDRILYISFEDEPDKLLAYRFSEYGEVYNSTSNTYNGTLEDGLTVYFENDVYSADDEWKLYDEARKKTSKIIINELDSNNLQQIINNASDLLEFLKQYRDEVYKPNKDKQIKIDVEERAKEQAEANRIKNSIPQIGMTPSEVRKSKWGSPDKINTDTYSWGTTEQWVYDKHGYVYFRNGVVSSVSQR